MRLLPLLLLLVTAAYAAEKGSTSFTGAIEDLETRAPHAVVEGAKGLIPDGPRCVDDWSQEYFEKSVKRFVEADRAGAARARQLETDLGRTTLPPVGDLGAGAFTAQLADVNIKKVLIEEF